MQTNRSYVCQQCNKKPTNFLYKYIHIHEYCCKSASASEKQTKNIALKYTYKCFGFCKAKMIIGGEKNKLKASSDLSFLE